MGRTERLNLLNASLNVLFIKRKNENIVDHRTIKLFTIIALLKAWWLW